MDLYVILKAYQTTVLSSPSFQVPVALPPPQSTSIIVSRMSLWLAASLMKSLWPGCLQTLTKTEGEKSQDLLNRLNGPFYQKLSNDSGAYVYKI